MALERRLMEVEALCFLNRLKNAVSHIHERSYEHLHLHNTVATGDNLPLFWSWRIFYSFCGYGQ